jgi:hypothetical protein
VRASGTRRSTERPPELILGERRLALYVHGGDDVRRVGLVGRAGPLIAFARLRRASDPVSPRPTGAALGAAAGAWGDATHVPICG